ncbi:ERF superfamily protein [Alteribacillus persepolensis]|uniref:ERF superfamily protein n=1 Tax=Alteribacillus persepolensis TaxID=568899 RepID=A0A1G8I676_9BACI|nr:ERF family protein [Alteribacillus persepolensis]SDI14465.1 ERF superfamily protein [Alteribacillus persepolensis]
MIFSETNTKIAPALVKAWGEIENPKHNARVKVKSKKTGTEYTFNYTDLKGIFDEAKRVFKDNGITIVQNAYTDTVEGRKFVSVETMLLHSSGEWVKSQPLQFEAPSGMQDMGGYITYMKRYSVSAMLGIATEEDDDANGASGNDYQYQSKTASPKQVGALKASVKRLADMKGKTDEEVYQKLKEHLGDFQNIEKLSSVYASKAIDTVNAWIKKYENN